MSTEKPFDSSREPAEQGFSFTDKRRVDPETGEVRNPGASEQDAPAGEPEATEEAPATDAPEADASDLGVEIPDDTSGLEDAEEQPAAPSDKVSDEAQGYLDQLQRLNAEYAAYRRRTEREQERAHAEGIAKVTEALIPVLDEVRLAREAGDLEGPFEKHVEKLFEALGKLGIEQYGQVGEEFDPNIHDALMQQPSDEVEEPTVFMVMQPGYRIGERVLRAARVGVHVPNE